MKRLAGGLVVLGLLGGGAAALAGPYMSGFWNRQAGTGSPCGGSQAPLAVPTAVGPWGQPVEMVAPYTAQPPSGEAAARAMLARHMPLEIMQQTGLGQSGIPGATGPRTLISPPGVPGAPVMPAHLRGPSSGGIQLTGGPPGAVAAVGAMTQSGGHGNFQAQRSEIRFVSPAGMKISWYGMSAGRPGLSTNSIEAPGRYNFVQAAIYRLKLSDIANRPGLELYPTLEVVPANHKTATFLAHAAVPISFTEEDFEQVAAGNFVVKVIYLPDPRFQDLATTGPDEVVSSRLEPGVDPIVEACRRGSILAIVRIGNIDLEAPNTPPMDAPSPYQMQKHAAMPSQPGLMTPPGSMNAGQGRMPPGMPLPPGMPMPPGMQMPQMPLPGMPTNQPQLPRPQGNPGPIGMLPDVPSMQQAQFTQQQPGRVPTPAELAGQSAPLPEKKPKGRGLFNW